MEKDINYDYYHKDLVDAAKVFAESFYNENRFISDIEMLELYNKMPEDSKEKGHKLLYKFFLDRLETAYLYGMQFAVSNDIGSTKPTHETQLCQYQKDKDFAFVFRFGDNDFGNYFEHAAKLYCDAYNTNINSIQLYSKVSPESVQHYVRHIDTLEKRETIIESLKIGVASYTFQRDVNSYHAENMTYENSAKDANRYANEYFDFNGERKLWDKDENGKYVVSGTEPRLVIGTRAEIETNLLNRETKDEESLMPRDFPVWCNGEVLIVYMKDGYLTYAIR